MHIAPPSHSLTVLIVDDDPVFSALAEAVLLDAGCAHVEIAAPGESGFRSSLSAGKHPDIIFLDLNMPGFDGLSAMRFLADIGYSGAIAVVSGANSAILQAAASLAGMHGLRFTGALSKPLKAKEVEALVASHVKGAPDTNHAGLPTDAGDMSGVAGFVPVYQPKVRVADKSIYGAEALMRVLLKDGRTVPPLDYLGPLTDSGRIADVTLAFLSSVLDDALLWTRDRDPRPVSINVPAPLLEQPGFMSRFAGIVHEKGAPPSWVTIEMTEAALPNDMSNLVEGMTRLRMAGFGIALDDYGTGMANYDILRSCPFTELKIDRSVVQAAQQDGLALGFVGNCVSIARALSMTIVAEGVETAEQADAMKRLGIDVIQGFFYSKPLTPEQYADLLRQPGRR